jgi:excisionase family DNA binding protein
MKKRNPASHVTPNLLTVDEFAAYINLSRASAWRLLKSGAVPRVRIGGCTRVRPADADALIARSIEAAA